MKEWSPVPVVAPPISQERRRWCARALAVAAGPALVGPVGVRGAERPPATGTEAVPSGRTLRVGPDSALKRIGDAARLAQEGDTVEIAAGQYPGDVAVWDKPGVRVRGIGGLVVVPAAGAALEGKATWIVRARNIVVENVALTGSRVPDRNGAGIRLEAGTLKVVNCRFNDNENGILTANSDDIELTVVASEFGGNGAGDGQSHNLYAGKIAKLAVAASYFHHARVGHLLKSRASRQYIFSNRFSDEADGTASYELECAGGGVAYVIGNIIQQGPRTENPTIVSFGTEGYAWPKNELYLVNNTLVDQRPSGGVFLRVRPGLQRLRVLNNLLFSPKSRLEEPVPGDYVANFGFSSRDVVDLDSLDVRLHRHSPLVGRGVDPGDADGVPLRMEYDYVHPLHTIPVPEGLLSPGAQQNVAA